MEPKTLELLEFPKVLSRLATHTSFSLGRSLALSLEPVTDPPEVTRRLRLTAEARALLESVPNLSVGGARDISASVGRTSIGGVLSPSELLDVLATVVAARTIKGTVAKQVRLAPGLCDLVGGITPLPSLEREINRCLNDRGEIVDEASHQLRKLRADSKIARNKLIDRLEGIMLSSDLRTVIQEPVVTMRDGRYVLPVKTDFRGQLPGIVHGHSASGATVFLEPLSCVDLNNSLRDMEDAEKREIERILAELSGQVADCAATLRDALGILAEVDLRLACARYANSLRAVEPEVGWSLGSETGDGLHLINARHPLIGASVVPISVWLGEEFQVLVITGPNTGGKTVALKTVGLLTLMAQAGMHIPADSGSRVRVFQSVYADIGDEQSIEQSLSTFSSHMRRLVTILEHADAQSLVLLDELGAGTDPTEGSALARAILGELLARGICSVATTHYAELKAYAYLTDGAQNASVEFDLQSLAPTYKLAIGLPGASNALAVASRLGLSKHLVERAAALVGASEAQVESLLGRIREDQGLAARELARATEIRDDAEKLRRRLEERLASIEREREDVLRAALEGFEKELSEGRSRLRQAMLTAERPNTPVLELQSLAADIRSVAKEMEQKSARLSATVPEISEAGRGEATAGRQVLVRSLGEVGELAGLLPDGRAEVLLGSFRVTVPQSDVVASSKATRLSARPTMRAATPEVGGHEPPAVELDLRGWRAGDVLPELEKYLDAAYLAGLPFVRIVHGKGTGVLRQVVKELLAGHPLVESFATAEARQGGDGVTVATFKG